MVPNLAVTVAEFPTLLGVRCGAIEHRSTVRETMTGPLQFESEFAFTLSGPPYVELIQQLVGSPWGVVGVHHIGLWCHDLAAEIARRADAGWRWESGKYYIAPDGTRVELASYEDYAPRLARYLEGGLFFED